MLSGFRLFSTEYPDLVENRPKVSGRRPGGFPSGAVAGL